MAKGLASIYSAGRRGKEWLKLKPAHTLDLVVLAAEWGSGRRQGWLSNLHLGARDPQSGGFVMLGKTFKGHDRRDAALADRGAAGPRDRPRGPHRPRPPRAGRRDRLQRRAGQPPLPRRRRPALRPPQDATATTRPPPRPTPSTACAACCRRRSLRAQLSVRLRGSASPDRWARPPYGAVARAAGATLHTRERRATSRLQSLAHFAANVRLTRRYLRSQVGWHGLRTLRSVSLAS